MNFTGPVLLDGTHTIDGFDCGATELNTWLTQRALSNQPVGGSSRTYVVLDPEGRVVAYYASSTATVLRNQATGRMRRNQPEPLPAVLLARLGVDLKHQNDGLGKALVKHFILTALHIADITGVRLMLVHARDWEAANFYARFGFEPSPIDELTMMMLVKDAAISTQ